MAYETANTTRYAMGAFKPHTNRKPLAHMPTTPKPRKYADIYDLCSAMVRSLANTNLPPRAGYCGRTTFTHTKFYSYTTCVAQYHPALSLWMFDNTAYGPTTAGHLDALRNAIRRRFVAPNIMHLPDVANPAGHANMHHTIHSMYTSLLAVNNKRYHLPRRVFSADHATRMLGTTRQLLDMREAQVGDSGEPVLYEQDADMFDLCVYAIEGSSCASECSATGGHPDPMAKLLRDSMLRTTAEMELAK